MNLPFMPNASARRELKQYQFGGYDHRRTCSDGGIYDMMNLCGDDYPIVSTRKKTVKHENVAEDTYAVVVVDNEIYRLAKSVAGDHYNLYKGFDTAPLVVDFIPLASFSGECQLVSMNGYIFAYPDGYWYNIGTSGHGKLDVWAEIENVDILSDSQMLIDYTNQVTIYADDDIFVGEPLEKYMHQNIGATFKFYRNASSPTPELEHTFAIQSMFVQQQTPPIEYINFLQGALAEYQGTWARVEIYWEFPKMKLPFVHENRIWGFDGNEIYASAFNDPWNFLLFEGEEADSYTYSYYTKEPFTGGISYNGYPTLFTENSVCRIYGDNAQNYTFDKTDIGPLKGVKNGNPKSLAIANNVLYYYSEYGIMAYTGGYPILISEQFGDRAIDSVVGGSDGERYYACIRTQDDFNESIMIYKDGMWHRHEPIDTNFFCILGYKLYAIGSKVYSFRDVDDDYDDEFEWFLETGDFYDPASGASYIPEPGKVTASKIVMRIELSEFTEDEGYCRMLIQYDSSGEWIPVKTIVATPKRTHTFAVVPHRCDHYRLRIEGKGEAHIYEVTRESKIGSTLKSTKGVQ